MDGSKIKRGYVDTSKGQIHYREAGSGPAVLFVHQAGRTGATYDRVSTCRGSGCPTRCRCRARSATLSM
jgi:hypothetical protein